MEMNRILAYAALSSTIFAGVPIKCKISVAKKPPMTAKESPIKKVNESVVPIISFNLCSFFAPYACPMRIELPDPIPMEKETSKRKAERMQKLQLLHPLQSIYRQAQWTQAARLIVKYCLIKVELERSTWFLLKIDYYLTS